MVRIEAAEQLENFGVVVDRTALNATVDGAREARPFGLLHRPMPAPAAARRFDPLLPERQRERDTLWPMMRTRPTRSPSRSGGI
jgi:hypothetical protein